MRKLIYTLAALTFLTGCPKKEEIQAMQNDLTAKKTEAIKVIQARNWSLEGLLKAQEYFFTFSEKIHLMIVEPEGAEDIKKLIKKKGMGNFCSTFVLPVRIWQDLESYCSDGQFYKCSPEIREYGNTINKFKELMGPSLAQSFSNEATCNN